MPDTVTIYSNRDHYTEAGITFTRAPQSYMLVEDVPGETTEEAKKRHARKRISATEHAKIKKMIERAKAHGIEPAIDIHDAEFEEAAARRRMDEHREELAAMRRARHDLEQAITALQIERNAATSELEEQRLELSRAQDQLQAAQAKIKEAEDGLGSIEVLSAEVAELKQAARASKRKK